MELVLEQPALLPEDVERAAAEHLTPAGAVSAFFSNRRAQLDPAAAGYEAAVSDTQRLESAAFSLVAAHADEHSGRRTGEVANVELEQVTISGFRCFKEEITLDYSAGGVAVITGLNLADEGVLWPWCRAAACPLSTGLSSFQPLRVGWKCMLSPVLGVTPWMHTGASSNGAGKTALAMAAPWALTGDLTGWSTSTGKKGLTKQHVIHHSEDIKKATVRLCGRLNGVPFEIRRSAAARSAPCPSPRPTLPALLHWH